MKIQKYHFWLGFFFFIFGITFAMIIWTIKSAVNTPVYEDKSFSTNYQDVDENYNSMVMANIKFNSKYDAIFEINGVKRGFELNDLRYGQRSLDKKSKNQNLLNEGDNSFKISILDKKTNKAINDVKVELQITRPIVDSEDILLKTLEGSFTIPKSGKWNIIAKVTIGDDIGYLYIKTMTKEK